MDLCRHLCRFLLYTCDIPFRFEHLFNLQGRKVYFFIIDSSVPCRSRTRNLSVPRQLPTGQTILGQIVFAKYDDWLCADRATCSVRTLRSELNNELGTSQATSLKAVSLRIN